MALHYTLLRFLRDQALDIAARSTVSPPYRLALQRFAEACSELSRFH